MEDKIAKRAARFGRVVTAATESSAAGAPKARGPDPIYGADGSVFSAPRARKNQPTQRRRTGKQGGGGGGGQRRRQQTYTEEIVTTRGAGRGRRPREETVIIEYVDEKPRGARGSAGRPGQRRSSGGSSLRGTRNRAIGKKASPRKPASKPKKPAEPKPSSDDLDRELESYMAVSKHPRIEA